MRNSFLVFIVFVQSTICNVTQAQDLTPAESLQRASIVTAKLRLIDPTLIPVPIPYCSIVVRMYFEGSGWLKFFSSQLVGSHIDFDSHGQWLRTSRDASSNFPLLSTQSILSEAEIIARAQEYWSAGFDEPFSVEKISYRVDSDLFHYYEIDALPRYKGVPYEWTLTALFTLDPVTGKLWELNCRRLPWIDPDASHVSSVGEESVKASLLQAILDHNPSFAITECVGKEAVQLRWIVPTKRQDSIPAIAALPDNFAGHRERDEAILCWRGGYDGTPSPSDPDQRRIWIGVEVDASNGNILTIAQGRQMPLGGLGTKPGPAKKAHPLELNWGKGPIDLLITGKFIKTSGDIERVNSSPATGKEIAVILRRGRLSVRALYDAKRNRLKIGDSTGRPTGELATDLRFYTRS